MGNHFVFVCGDTGGTNYFLPVIRHLNDLGHKTELFIDPDGKGVEAAQKAGVSFEVGMSINKLMAVLNSADIFCINTCASATQLQEYVANEVYTRKPLVMGADGFFNHAFEKWQKVKADYWFAIDESHAQSVRELRSNLEPERVRTVGQPAFDSVLNYIPGKKETRERTRELLNIFDAEKVILWWSQGMLDLIYEDVCMLMHGLRYLSESGSLYTLILRIHPKLNKTVSEDYVESLNKLLKHYSPYSFRTVEADKIAGEELCLASDVILSITCTEDIKNVMMGGPPVVHMIGPQAQKWFEQELKLTRPYLSDIKSGRSLVAWSVDQVGPQIEKALDPDIQKQLLAGWQPPTQKAVDRMAEELIKIANL